VIAAVRQFDLLRSTTTFYVPQNMPAISDLFEMFDFSN
jgi:hypothetical protein